jgi:hypothetical protein
MDMTEQKYEQFLQDRNFKFQLAQFASDEEHKNFNRWLQEQELSFNINKEEWDRYIQETELAFNIDKENWNRFAWEQEMAFNKEKEAFDQALAIANHNANLAAQAHRQAMDRIAAEQAAQRIALEREELRLRQEIETSKQDIYQGASQFDAERKKFDAFYNQLKTTGVMTSVMAKYFGVETGARIEWETTKQAVLRKAAQLDAKGVGLEESAYMIKDEMTTADKLADFMASIGVRTE